MQGTVAKRTNRYELTLKRIGVPENDEHISCQIHLVVENHDDIFAIIEKLNQKDLFSNRQQSAEFAIGLKLFSEVMISNRDHLLFEAFQPAFRLFIEKLKDS